MTETQPGSRGLLERMGLTTKVIQEHAVAQARETGKKEGRDIVTYLMRKKLAEGCGSDFLEVVGGCVKYWNEKRRLTEEVRSSDELYVMACGCIELLRVLETQGVFIGGRNGEMQPGRIVPYDPDKHLPIDAILGPIVNQLLESMGSPKYLSDGQFGGLKKAAAKNWGVRRGENVQVVHLGTEILLPDEKSVGVIEMARVKLPPDASK